VAVEGRRDVVDFSLHRDPLGLEERFELGDAGLAQQKRPNLASGRLVASPSTGRKHLGGVACSEGGDLVASPEGDGHFDGERVLVRVQHRVWLLPLSASQGEDHARGLRGGGAVARVERRTPDCCCFVGVVVVAVIAVCVVDVVVVAGSAG
jgi:hypothetical protein